MQTESDLFSHYGMKLIVNVDIAHVLHRTALHTSKAWNPGNKKKEPSKSNGIVITFVVKGVN